MHIDELVERFEIFDDWEGRYAYLIDLGRKLQPLDPGEKTEANKVRGCLSQVWLVSEIEGDRVKFVADSDSAIVRGLIAILLTLYSDRPAGEIVQTSVDDVFTRIGLDEHLSPNRRNGFYSMVQRMKQLAVDAA